MVSSTKNVKFRITYTIGIAAICPTTQQTSTANEKNSKKPSIVAAKTCIAGTNTAAPKPAPTAHSRSDDKSAGAAHSSRPVR